MTDPSTAELPRVLTVEAFCRVCGIGRTSFYEAVKRKQIRIRKFGTRTLVTADQVDQFLNGLPAA
jgi:excisionase family DNA binding protein